MIVRMWRGQAKAENADAYRRHLESSVFPHLRALPGFMGASLLTRDKGEHVELLTLTRWLSMDAIKPFSGPDPEKAVVEQQARAVLTSFDDFVSHHEVVCEAAPADAAIG